MMPILAGVAVVAVAGYFGVTQFTGKSKTPEGPPMDSAVVAPQEPITEDAPDAYPPGEPTNTQPRPEPRTVPPNTPSTSSTPTTPSAALTIATWKTRVEALENESDSLRAAGVARQAIRELGAIEPSLVGLARDDARFVLLLANYQLGNTDEICRVGAQVTSSRLLQAEQTGLARTLRQASGCP
jgi:hypothetical protein